MGKRRQTLAYNTEQIRQGVVKTYISTGFIYKIRLIRRTINKIYQYAEKKYDDTCQDLRPVYKDRRFCDFFYKASPIAMKQMQSVMINKKAGLPLLRATRPSFLADRSQLTAHCWKSFMVTPISYQL